LVITAKSLLSVAAVPGSRQGRITLRIDRKDLPSAAEFVDNAYESSGGS
jgi:hypothetical protein